jgi:hypothetical protein
MVWHCCSAIQRQGGQLFPVRTDKKENKIFLIYKEIQNGTVAKSHMKKGFLIYEKMRKYLTINEEAINHSCKGIYESYMPLQLLHSKFPEI